MRGITYDGKPCKWCGGTKKYRANSKCVLYDSDPRHLLGGPEKLRQRNAKNNPRHKARYAAEKRAWYAAHPDTTVCCQLNCYEPAVEAFAYIGHPYCQRHGERKVTQDLSTYPQVAHGTSNGRRWFRVQLPIPGYTKHTRVAVNSRTKGRYLCQAAKEYQQFLVQLRIVRELEEPWLRGEYIISFTTYHPRVDDDQWSGGLKDDLVTAGFTVDDTHCFRTITTRIRVPKTEQRLIVFGRERYAKEHRPESPSFTAERATS